MADASPDSAPASTKQAALLEALERRITGHEARVAAKKERTEALSAALTSSDLSAEEREAMMREHAEMEKVFSRRYRRRFSRADFESLAIVGKGHFGEVSHSARALRASRFARARSTAVGRGCGAPWGTSNTRLEATLAATACKAPWREARGHARPKIPVVARERRGRGRAGD